MKLQKAIAKAKAQAAADAARLSNGSASAAGTISGTTLSNGSTIAINTITGYATQAESLAEAVESTRDGVTHNRNNEVRLGMVNGMADGIAKIEDLKSRAIAASRALSGPNLDAAAQAVRRIEEASNRAKTAYRAAAASASPFVDPSRIVSISSAGTPAGAASAATPPASGGGSSTSSSRTAPAIDPYYGAFISRDGSTITLNTVKLQDSLSVKQSKKIKSIFTENMSSFILSTYMDTPGNTIAQQIDRDAQEIADRDWRS